MYRQVPLGNLQRRNAGGDFPGPGGARGFRAEDQQRGQRRGRNPLGRHRDTPHQQDHQRGNNQRQGFQHLHRHVDDLTLASVEGTVGTMRLRSRLQDLENVLDLYRRFEPRERDGHQGELAIHVSVVTSRREKTWPHSSART